MRRPSLWLLAFLCTAQAVHLQAATARVMKVLPLYLDLKGREALSPSLYDRDAYQAILRDEPEKRSGLRFAVQWKTKGAAWEPLVLRVEARGVAQGGLPKTMTMEKPVMPTSWLGRWSSIVLRGEDYKKFGEVTAWRVTIWEGSQLRGEQKSFLW